MTSSRSLSSILDEIVSELILIDPESSGNLANLSELVGALEEEIPEEYHQQLVEYLGQMSEGDSPRQSITDAIENFQESVESIMSYYQDADENSDEESASAGASFDSGGELPEYLEDPTLLEDFLVEAEEHLESAEKHLIALEKNQENRELIDAIFRPFHTIKGIAGFLALYDIEEIAHVYEDFLDDAREGRRTITRRAVDFILQAIDAIREIMDALRTSLETGTEVRHSVNVDAVLSDIRSYDPEAAAENEAGVPQDFSGQQDAIDFPESSHETEVTSEEGGEEVRDTLESTASEDSTGAVESDSEEVAPSPDGDPEEAAGSSQETDMPEKASPGPPQEIPGSAELPSESADTAEDTLPEALQDPELLQDFLQESEEYLSSVEQNLIEWENDPENLDIVNDIFRPFHTIKGVAGFLNLPEIETLSHEFEHLLGQARESKIRLQSEITDLILTGVDALRGMMEALRSSIEAGKLLPHNIEITPLIEKIQAIPSGEVPLGDQAKHTTEEEETPGHQQAGDNGATREKSTPSAVSTQRRKSGSAVKVDINKMDHLIDMVGELVIVQNMVAQNPIVRGATDKRLLADISQLKRITSTLQNISMSLRMVPIEATFRKMQRIVRDLAHKSGKKIDLRLSGEQTEIDRNMVETLYVPLVHMIRNACDHGIEMPDQRAEAGKNPTGTVHLNAYQRGGNIVIEISDDGAGLNKQSILNKAKERDLVPSEESLTDKQIYELLFHPGFSTAHQVTEVSGRGVGMDVVRRTVEQMRGQIDIETTPGEGTAFYIRLPLTLAIIDGVIVRVGDQRYVIPTLAIEESVQVSENHCNIIAGRGETIMVRDHIFPLIRLHHLFNVKDAVPNPWEGIVMLVDLGGDHAGILVDELVDKQEVVIKSMGKHFQSIPGVSGGAILGDGSVGLILDVSNLLVVRDEKTREEEQASGTQNGNSHAPAVMIDS